ncbi:RasGAP-like protein [Rhizodiscina lignyota]|uniref:RasGAP-like protein n=1 Tax=Rhizodiscina lignyota TaxID=1504668 RepID=A0A9P4M283_9PEZI|nr:RasGAP-like protein [Rhizodiscina lignyota]
MYTSTRPRSTVGHPATSPSPLRHASTASSNSSNYSNQYPPSRTSTVSSNGSSGFTYPSFSHKRGLSEAAGTHTQNYNGSPERQRTPPRALPKLPLETAPLPDRRDSYFSHGRSYSVDDVKSSMHHNDGSMSPPPKMQPLSMAMSRSDSVRGANRGDRRSVHFAPNAPELQSLGKATTGHLRTLSKLATEDGDFQQDLGIKSPEQEVVGLHGRRRLQRATSKRGRVAQTTAGYGGRIWMDTQRQYLQAYEYLCHIGEAKEWIEDIIHHPIPPIVELEEALRNGVTLAEVVQALNPGRTFRIFRHERLQFRHSDNIAIFFNFLAQMELPELFRFELVDLYEKKNIPKVIYCIHALSWLLFRRGIVDFRIGNLVGQLQFEDHELEAMQKGLDRSGISMPNFGAMSAAMGIEPEPEPEPQETEDERVDRELHENEDMILDLQAQIRGAIVRLQLGDTMQKLWDTEDWIVDLQSRIRGEFARQITDYKLEMRNFAVNLQSAAKGFIVRSRKQDKEAFFQNHVRDVVLIQSLVRGRKAKAEAQYIKSRVQKQENGIRSFQAAIRGAMQRWNVGDQYHATREAVPQVQQLQAAIRAALVRKQVDREYSEIKEEEPKVEKVQAAIRGMLQRSRLEADREVLIQEQQQIVSLQANARAMLERRKMNEIRRELETVSLHWGNFQSLARGNAMRSSVNALRNELGANEARYVQLQSAIRGLQARDRFLELRAALASNEDSVLGLQSLCRAYLLRSAQKSDMQALQVALPSIIAAQSAARGYLHRQTTFDLLCDLNDQSDSIIALQSLIRSSLLQSDVLILTSNLAQHEESIIELQTLMRGSEVRGKFKEKMKFYRQNMEKVVKIQSFVRGRQQGEAYKTLTSGKNPPVGTIKNFVHLLNDSDFDFDEEIEFERMRKTVVQHVRQNELAEQYIDQLDIKIALLVKNKITLDEVIKHQKHFGGHVGNLLTNKDLSSKDPFDLKALNKNSRKKLEHYQELFFVLQTQPQYLARLFRAVREKAMPEKECSRIELLMMGLFGFAQKRREEYYLLKLIARSIKEEIDTCNELQSYLRGNFFWSKIFTRYIRSPKDRKYLRDVLSPVIKEDIIENEGLDLESDPMQIYRSLINNEELRTGQRSRRNPDIPREEAIRDPETRDTFIRHLQDLRDITDHFFLSLEETLHRMPFGVRYLASQTFQILCKRFPQEPQQHLLKIVGNWIWKNYLSPALLQPETWGVVDRGLSPLHKRNLGEVAKVLGQVATGRPFGQENVYLRPLDNYIGSAVQRIEEIWANMIEIQDMETHFDIDEFNDLYARTKPTLYIKLADIFSIHHLIANDISALCPSQDDMLREIIRELGSAKNNESEITGATSSSNEISLNLNPKYHDLEDPDAAVKSLFMETKRCVLYIIRIQTGPNLLEIMVRPIADDDEDRWAQLVHEEHVANRSSPKKRSAYTSESTNPLIDITTLTYTELKRTALENILTLEKTGRISRHNHYQDLLNAIAVDIRTKHRRRVQRAKELEGVRATLGALDEKAIWLDQQLKSYNDYIEQAMVTLQNKKGKKRFLLPFTKQYNHERELQRSGRVPKFGSFKYSARNLADKGVLVSWKGFSERQWDKINITISSDEVGLFHVEGSVGSMMIPGASAMVPLDDLLQAQFNNTQFINLFGDENVEVGGKGRSNEGALRLNVNLLVHLLMRKFYRDE